MFNLRRMITDENKKILYAFIAVTVLAVAVWFWQYNKGVMNATGNLIRFHVIANSDSPADQVLKLKVRDEIIRTMTPLLSDTRDIREARKRVDDNLELMVAIATQVVKKYGYDYQVGVMHGNYSFPEKVYQVRYNDEWRIADLKLPAGNYEAVRVVIGSGTGSNWWCVMFPPLCFVNPLEVYEEKEKLPVEIPAFKYVHTEPEVAVVNPPVEIPAFKYVHTEPEVVAVKPVVKPTVEYRFKFMEWYRELKKGY